MLTEKFGVCPSTVDDSVYKSAGEACSKESECPDIQKCCVVKNKQICVDPACILLKSSNVFQYIKI